MPVCRRYLTLVTIATGKPVSFSSLPTAGVAELDEMVCISLSYLCPRLDTTLTQ